MIDQLIRDAFEEIVSESPKPPRLPVVAKRAPSHAIWLRSFLAAASGVAVVALALGWANFMAPGGPAHSSGVVPEPATTQAPATTLSPTIIVPELIGLDLETASTRLVDAGLGAVWHEPGAAPTDLVRGQLPISGERVEPGGSVVISIVPTCAFYDPPSQSEDDVSVLFWCGIAPSDLTLGSVWRTRQQGEDQLTATIEGLLAGPSDFEQELGFGSVFGRDTAEALESIITKDDVVVADFNDMIRVEGTDNIYGRATVSAELRANFFQFESVESVEFHIDGSCGAWTTYFGTEGCRFNRPD